MAKNEILKELENRSEQKFFLSLMRYKSKYGEVIDEGKNWHWKRDIDRDGMWADSAEYVFIPSKKLKDYKYEFDLSEYKPRGIFKQVIEITQKKIADIVISEDIEKMAVENPDGLRELLAEKQAAMASEVTWYRDEYITEKIADSGKINDKAKVKMSSADLKDPRKLAHAIATLAVRMTIPSKDYNKKGETACLRDCREDAIIVIDPASNVTLELGLYAGATHLAYVNLKERFAKVVEMAMPKNMKVLIVDKKAVGAPLTIDKTYTKFEEGNMCAYIFNHIWFDADLLDTLPAACIIEDNSTTSTISTKKDILKEFAKLKDGNNQTMKKDQAEEWKDKGFNFEQAKEWIDAGLLVSDANFADWLVNTKGGDYAEPDWVLNNAGQNAVKNIDELRTESGV